ncbi:MULTISPECIES: thiamine ABC transporter substrate-binding protein [Anaerolinea]|nr:thiamine ABC transporter substrate-binding protein [Anaerolinea thermophila]
MLRIVWLWILVLLIGVTACTPQTATPAVTSVSPAGQPVELRVMTHDSFAVSEDIVRAFEAAHQVKVTFIKSGDTGAALNRAVLTRENPQADVFYGVDNTFLSRALDEDIFEPYASPLLEKIPAEFKLDPTNRALPVDYGDVCINYDKAYFREKNLPVPQSLEELTRPEYRGLLVVENPATSSPGLAFLFATIAHFGEEGYLDYWKALRANEVVVASDWESAYYTYFSASSGKGPQPMVVSYASSPAAEVIFAEKPLEDAPTASLTAPGMCYRQIEFVGILKGTPQRKLAEAFVDFMLGKTFQEDMPLQMFVFPVNPEAVLPEAFTRYAQVAEQPATLDSARIAARREAWIQAWTEAVLR